MKPSNTVPNTLFKLKGDNDQMYVVIRKATVKSQGGSNGSEVVLYAKYGETTLDNPLFATRLDEFLSFATEVL